MTPPTAAPDDRQQYLDPATAATLASAENMMVEVPAARVPIGAQMKMLGGMFTVTNADRHRLTVRGPLGKLKLGKVVQIFAVTAQVTMLGKHVATFTARRGVFDYRPILRIVDDVLPQGFGEVREGDIIGLGPDALAMIPEEATS